MNSNIRGMMRSRFFILLCAALVIAGGAVAALAYYVNSMTVKVILNDGGNVVQILTMEETVGKLLEKYEIELRTGDIITPGLDVKLEQGDTVEITRAFKVKAMADGKMKTVYMTGGTVANALNKAGIILRKQDEISHNPSQLVAPGTNIKVTRIDEKTMVEKEPIPYQVITRRNNTLDEGVERIIQDGNQGEIQRQILICYRDGVEVSRQLTEEKVAVQPVNRIVEKGTVKNIVTSRGDRIRYTGVKTMTATAYTAGYESTGKNPGHPLYGITRSGKKVKSYHTIAASWSVPFGTKVYIPYMVEFWKKRGVEISGIFTVEDRGSAVKGNKVDIYIEDLPTCQVFGRRNVKVYFLK